LKPTQNLLVQRQIIKTFYFKTEKHSGLRKRGDRKAYTLLDKRTRGHNRPGNKTAEEKLFLLSEWRLQAAAEAAETAL